MVRRWARSRAITLITVVSFAVAGCAAAPSVDASSREGEVGVILWSTPSGPADGMATTPELVVVAGGEELSAFDRTTGERRWSSSMSDTAGPTPVVVTSEGVVVVAPPYEEVQAFDVRSGESVPVPHDVEVPAMEEWGVLPPGYAFDDDGLAYEGRILWPGAEARGAFVGRVGALTVVNSDDAGLRVIDDEGKVLAEPEVGAVEYDAVPIHVADDVAVTVTSDGVLYAIGSPGS